MKTIIKYRIIYLNPAGMLAWREDKQQFIPGGLNLYITLYDSLDDACRALRKVKKLCSGWADDIVIDSVQRYVDEN